MAPAAGRQTYRVRQIPAHCSQFYDLARLLAYVLDYHKTITVRSLASSIDSFENPPTKVATVTFEDEPDQLRAGQNPARSEWCLPAAVYAHNLIIDSHFRGFTPLNEVDMDHHILDCIAITGLSGHAFGSWCAQDRTVDFMWLRDALPRRYPRMRVLTYGYDSHLLGSQSFQSIREISLALITKMRSIGLAEPSSKPLLFLAHSLGGIVVKEAIARIANSPPLEATFMWKVKRVIFFGVPNRGMRISHLLPLVEQQPNEPLVQTLAEGSSYLEHLDAQFYGISSMRQVDLVSIYETHKSPTPQLSSDGQWKKDGPYEILVQLESAIQRGTKPENQHPIDKDHSSLVKFNENEDDLTAVLFFLRSLYESLDGHTRVGHAQQSKKGFSAADRVAGSESETAVDLLSQSQKEQTLKSILESIHFEDAEFRYSMVEQAHGRTFDWLLRQPRVGVLNWLRWGTGIFWISGKPGSGKSTAMKHIYRWYNTSQQHSSDTVSSQEIAARFFFFQRGSVIQKSYEGLLRSLLHQILLKLGLSCVNIFPEWFKPATKSPKEWSFHRLDRLWDQLMGQKHSKLNLILFLDALDEFDGSAEKVALFIKKTVHRSSESMTKVRICCASRPWDAFADSFKSCPTFQMEDHTEPDIRQFVMDTMSTHEAMKPWLRSSLRLERQPLYELMDEILRQAKGVFIWVRLVLQEMLDARTEGAEIDELRRMIGQLPHELEDLYQALLARVKKPEFRQETYAMLEILIRSPRPLQLTEFAWILRCAVAPDLEHSVRGLQQLGEELSSAEIDTLRRRIRSRCGGLVEIVRRPQDDDKVSKQLSLEKVNAPTGSSVAEDDSGSSSRAEIFQEQVTGFAGSLPPPTRDHGPVQVSAPDVRLPSTAFWASQIPYAQFGGWQHPSLAHRGWAPGLYAPPPALVPPASSYLAPFGSHPLPYTSMHSIPSPFPPYLNFAQPGGFLPGPYAASYSPWTTNTADQLHSHFLQSNGGFAYQGHAPDAFAPPFTGGNPNSPAPNNNKTPDAQQHVPHPRRGLPGFSRGTIGETSGVPNKNTPAYPNRSGNQQSVYMVQLMHQTVKEFVTSPGFKGSLGVDHSDMKSENGHSYFAKFGFTLIKSVVRRRGKVFSRIPWLSADKAHNLFALCGDSFHNAEKTTGFAQSSLLDDLDAGQFTCFFPQQRYDAEAEEDAMKDYRPRRWPIDSQISFAAVMRLPLYLKAKFSREQNWLFSREPRILHNIIEKFHFWPRFDAIRPSITMLQQGASVHNTFENLTVFQALFRKIDPTGDPGTFSMTFGQLARLLLENGSDPNCDIFYLFDNIESFGESPELYTSKALHLVLSSPDMVRLMIEYGADVNGRNGRGETPLDVLAELWMTRWTEHVTMDDVELHSAAILINNGGLASRKSYKFLNFRRGGAEDDGDEDDDDDDDAPAINIVDEDDDDGRYTAYDSKYGRLFEDTADWTLRQQGEQVFDLDALRYWDTPSEFDSPRPPQSRPQLELAAVESDW